VKFIQIIRFGNQVRIQKERIFKHVDLLHIKAGQEYKCTIEEYEEDRSLEQNSYFHVAIVPACATLGYTNEEAKATLKAELLPIKKVRKLDGSVTQELTHTGDLGVRKMSKFIDECIILLGTYGVTVQPPTWRN